MTTDDRIILEALAQGQATIKVVAQRTGLMERRCMDRLRELANERRVKRVGKEPREGLGRPYTVYGLPE